MRVAEAVCRISVVLDFSRAPVADYEALGRLEAIVHENNRLRYNNEQLTKEVARLGDLLEQRRTAITTAQTMAAHWRMKADPASANYDATKEDAP